MKPWNHVYQIQLTATLISLLLSIWVYGGTAFNTCFKMHHFQLLFFQPIFLSFIEMRENIFLTLGEKRFKSSVKFMSHAFLKSLVLLPIHLSNCLGSSSATPPWRYSFYWVSMAWCWQGAAGLLWGAAPCQTQSLLAVSNTPTTGHGWA